MRGAHVAASFEDFAEGVDVVAQIGAWILQRVADAGLRREMHDVRETLVAKQLSGGRGISEIDALKREARLTGQVRQPGFLQRDVVVGIEVVDAYDRCSASEQR